MFKRISPTRSEPPMQRCLQARPKLYGAPRDIRRRYVFVRTIIQIGPTIDGYRLFIYNVSMDWVARAPSTGTMAGHRGDMLSDQTIIDAVQAALRQLYDSQTLRSSPLIGALGLTGSPNAASELRQALTNPRGCDPMRRCYPRPGRGASGDPRVSLPATGGAGRGGQAARTERAPPEARRAPRSRGIGAVVAPSPLIAHQRRANLAMMS